MNVNRIDPRNEQDSVNKRYVESQLFDYQHRNGTEPMTSNLNMSNYRILNLSNPTDAANNPLVIKKNELRRFAKSCSVDSLTSSSL